MSNASTTPVISTPRNARSAPGASTTGLAMIDRDRSRHPRPRPRSEDQQDSKGRQLHEDGQQAGRPWVVVEGRVEGEDRDQHRRQYLQPDTPQQRPPAGDEDQPELVMRPRDRRDRHRQRADHQGCAQRITSAATAPGLPERQRGDQHREHQPHDLRRGAVAEKPRQEAQQRLVHRRVGAPDPSGLPQLVGPIGDRGLGQHGEGDQRGAGKGARGHRSLPPSAGDQEVGDEYQRSEFDRRSQPDQHALPPTWQLVIEQRQSDHEEAHLTNHQVVQERVAEHQRHRQPGRPGQLVCCGRLRRCRGRAHQQRQAADRHGEGEQGPDHLGCQEVHGNQPSQHQCCERRIGEAQGVDGRMLIDPVVQRVAAQNVGDGASVDLQIAQHSWPNRTGEREDQQRRDGYRDRGQADGAKPLLLSLGDLSGRARLPG